MPIFPSKEWCEEAVRVANADPEAVEAGEGWEGDLGAIIDAEPGKLAKAFVVYVVPKDGKFTKLKVLPDPDDLDELEPAYLAKAPYSVWKALLKGELDPMEAVLRRRISFRGDVQPIVERMRYKGVAERVLGQVETIFADEKR